MRFLLPRTAWLEEQKIQDVETQWMRRNFYLHAPQMSVGYLLNPRHHQSAAEDYADAANGFFANDFATVSGYVFDQDVEKMTQASEELVQFLQTAFEGPAEHALTKSPPIPCLQWWMSYGRQWSKLYQVARWVCSGVAATGASERSWKEFKRILSPHRNRLSKQKLHMLGYAQMNGKLSRTSPLSDDILRKMFEVEFADELLEETDEMQAAFAMDPGFLADVD